MINTDPQSAAMFEAIGELLEAGTLLKKVNYLRWTFRIHSLAWPPACSLCFQYMDENRTS